MFMVQLLLFADTALQKKNHNKTQNKTLLQNIHGHKTRCISALL